MSTAVKLKTGFAPVADRHARVLILGSMPGEASLARQQYYAHPRNSFWPIIESLFGVTEPLEYQGRTRLLRQHGIALWDVLRSCVREGSLDTAIETDSIIVNPFEDFFKTHEQIRYVFFNGARAEKEFRRHVLPIAAIESRRLRLQRLPSTSPAHAAMNWQQKQQAWRVIVDCVS